MKVKFKKGRHKKNIIVFLVVGPLKGVGLNPLNLSNKNTFFHYGKNWTKKI